MDDVWAAASRRITVKSITAAAPKGAPQTLARPPTAAITTSLTEAEVERLRADKQHIVDVEAAGHAGIDRAQHQHLQLVRLASTPMLSAADSLAWIARKARPKRELTMLSESAISRMHRMPHTR